VDIRKMEATRHGFEPSPDSSGNTGVSENRDAKSDAISGELAEVIAAWPTLAAIDREEVMRIVKGIY
jgi:hypothetical protein